MEQGQSRHCLCPDLLYIQLSPADVLGGFRPLETLDLMHQMRDLTGVLVCLQCLILFIKLRVTVNVRFIIAAI